MAAAASSPVIWQPNSWPQVYFLSTRADEVLYGGAAGGGKSAVAIAGPLRWVHEPEFSALILRRETTQLVDLLTKAQRLYPRLKNPPTFNGTSHTWTFPSGATIRFNHCKELNDAFDYQGQEFQYVCFDELTHFAESQYREIRTRIRSTNPRLPRYTRATSNPGGVGHEWVLKRFGPWLDPEYQIEGRAPRIDVDGRPLPPAEPGEVLHFEVDDEGRERWLSGRTDESQSRTFIPARLTDNPDLVRNDPKYVAKIRDNDPVRRAQLERGDWLVKPAAGLYFKRAWMPTVDGPPPAEDVVGRVRYWDRASTEGGGDWTVGVRMSRTRQGLYFIEDVVRVQKAPGGVEETIRQTAERDDREAPGTVLALEQDPGQAGKFEAAYYQREFAGRVIRIVPKRADKITAAGPFSAQAAPPGGTGHGNVRVCRGAWNGAFYAELESFPDGDKDDQVDAGSGAFSQLAAISLVSHRPRTAAVSQRPIHG